MTNKRSSIDRRNNQDRRQDGASLYNGPENRGIKYRRSDKVRRGKE
jgi:hypothetical protein